VFLDRDGTLIEEVGYLSRMEDLRLFDGTAEALDLLRRAGYLCLLVTNQSGVARGYFDGAFVERVHGEIQARLQALGTSVDGFYVCPHHPDHSGACACRKPLPGLLHRAARDWGLDLRACWVVGDKPGDVELARAAGCRAALVRTGYGGETELQLQRDGISVEVIADDLLGAARELLRT
jgi:D-glycero-D-manno-heptose 1,7-bisphosphate phosphatase